jgi:hypothetical protein
LCQILRPWSGGVPEVSTQPRVKTNVEVQNTNNFLIFPHVQSTVLSLLWNLFSLFAGKRDDEKKVGNLLGIFCGFGLLAVVCDVRCVLSLVLI